MAKETRTLDDIFGEEESLLSKRARERAEHEREFNETPEGKALLERAANRRQAEIDKEIRQGLRDENGDWIEQPEADDEDDETEDDDE